MVHTVFLIKAVVWALIFLTKLRFPPGVFIAAIVLKEHDNFNKSSLEFLSLMC